MQLTPPPRFFELLDSIGKEGLPFDEMQILGSMQALLPEQMASLPLDERKR
jgi:hypothetical protein